jgi:hypothetical protein
MKEIIFRPNSQEAELTVPPPKPAKHYLPDWYKKVPLYTDNKMKIDSDGLANNTMKACLPFLDAFTSGYIQETWCDVYINANTSEYRYSTTPIIMNHRQSDKQHYPKIKGFCSQEFVWNQTWIPELPNGYSMLYMHPLNRFDLPCLSLSGIIDHDRLKMEKIATHPFFVREGFEGIIPKGTPMFQMIPLKRDNWSSVFKKFDEILLAKSLKIRQYFVGGYKKLFWQKKDYQ